MCEDGNMLVVQAYSLPAWLKAKVEDEARRNERAASAELRVRLAASFGLRTDGTQLAEHSSASKAGGDARGTDMRLGMPFAEHSSVIKAGGDANGGPGDEA